MTRKTRLIILLACVACFLVIAPFLVLYSMGYRFDPEKMKITLTGGIYVRTYPAADQITIDSKITDKPGIFSNSIFVQSLLPSNHTILIKKIGYYDYFKTLPVQEKVVTKLEEVLLIKKNIKFVIVEDLTQSPFIPEISTLTAAQKSALALKKIITYSLQGNSIIWLGTDGFLYKSELANLSNDPIKITLTPIKIIRTGSYKIIADKKDIFVNDNGRLLFLNNETSDLFDFHAAIKDAKISPDGKNIIYYNDNIIYISQITAALPKTGPVKNALYKSSEKINNCLWLNNNYIIFTDGLPGQGDKITISEIDYRGNINAITLPQMIVISPDEKIDVKKPEIFFNQRTGKLYILTNKTLLLSEKIAQ